VKLNREKCREQFLKINQELYQEYQGLEKDYLMSEVTKARWIEGDPHQSRALFLAHGYMGSPNEMLFLAEPFIKAGWTVVAFLIPGHGATSSIANAFDKNRWRLEMQRQFNLVLESFDEVRAVGFSTGALLLHDFLLRQSRNAPLPSSLKSLHLISPYFVQRVGKKLSCLDPILEKLINNISVDLAYALSRFPDLRVMTLDRPSYNQRIPLSAAREIKELGLQVYKQEQAASKLKLPTQLFLSQNDWTVKIQASKTVVYRDIEAKNIEVIYYPGKEPHHLMAPVVSTVAENIQQRLFCYCCPAAQAQ